MTKNQKTRGFKGHQWSLGLAAFAVIIFTGVVFVLPLVAPAYRYEAGKRTAGAVASAVVPTPVTAAHVETPAAVKALYMSSWVAGTQDIRARLLKLIDDTELNAVVIDIKDYTGKISFAVSDPTLKPYEEIRIRDLRELITLLHEKNVYVIGRIAVFQDPAMVKAHPEWAVKRASDGAIWKDRKGISWIDPGARGHWAYTAKIGWESYRAGFDELNFDYIRFPSDGNMADILYPFSESRIKHEVMRDFFKYLHLEFSNKGPKISADLFGMTMTNTDDLGIGQVLEDALPYFDYLGPMVYPSHYPPGFHGYKNPAAVPYEVIKYNMDEGVRRAKMASTTPAKLRPWLQDFDLGATYTAEMVREQIQATYDAGLNSWMLWDPGNRYTPAALKSTP